MQPVYRQRNGNIYGDMVILTYFKSKKNRTFKEFRYAKLGRC